MTLACLVLFNFQGHYNDAIMSAMASQITSPMIVHSTVYSGADRKKHQSSASLAFVKGIHRWIPAQRARNAENVSIWWRHHRTANRALGPSKKLRVDLKMEQVDVCLNKVGAFSFWIPIWRIGYPVFSLSRWARAGSGPRRTAVALVLVTVVESSRACPVESVYRTTVWMETGLFMW